MRQFLFATCFTRQRNGLYFALSLLLSTLAAGFEGLSFGLIMAAFALLNGETLPLNLPKILHLLTQQELFLMALLTGILLQLLRSGLSFLSQYTTLLLSTQVQLDRQEKIYKKIFSMSFSAVNRYKVGDLVEHARAPAQAIPIVLNGLNRFLTALLLIGASLVVMGMISFVLTLFLMILFGGVTLVQRTIMGRIAKGSSSLAEELADLSKQTVQAINGVRTVFTFHQQKNVLERTFGMLKRIASSTKQIEGWNYAVLSINEGVGMLLVGAALMMGAYLLAGRGALLLPQLIAFLAVSHRLSGRVQMAMSSFSGMMVYSGAIERMEHFLGEESKEPVEEGEPLTEPVREIRFEGVYLNYPPERIQWATKDLSLTIRQGKMIAFVGASGAGKSSIMDLLVRLHLPTAGTIFVNDRPLSTYTVESWRAKLGVVSQEPFIFNETVAENIAFGSRRATPEAIEEAAKQAYLHERILQLPHGYQTVVGEKGYRLSGGEKQRLSLARALVRDPEILLLDEATSNLDSHSESLIQRALAQFSKKRTVIIVAHRLSTIRGADEILVIEEGEVRQRGSHEELLQANGLYAYLWNLQSTTTAS